MCECHLSNVLSLASWWLGFVVSVVHMSKLDSWAGKCDPHPVTLVHFIFISIGVARQTSFAGEIWESDGFILCSWNPAVHLLVCENITLLLHFFFFFFSWTFSWKGEQIRLKSSGGFLCLQGDFLLCALQTSPIHFKIKIMILLFLFFLRPFHPLFTSLNVSSISGCVWVFGGGDLMLPLKTWTRPWYGSKRTGVIDMRGERTG